ncbi:zinc finger RNA-binding protein-like isoform X3 [Diabrotica undecimpunctata]|uniref:zinc finger RNA-binding protein-like isoform X3 n=1 Tax=Diabrotica undecimpunctata TaxID=50387 RepID=UPI003B63D0D2
MATNNYFGFTHGGTQYGHLILRATTGAYQAGQAGYAVATPATAAAAATYGTQRPTSYDTAYQAAAAASQGTYAAVGTTATPAYEYGYGQTAATGYTSGYDQTAAAAAAVAAAAKPASYATTYTQRTTSQQAQQAAAFQSAAVAAAAVVKQPAQYTATYQPTATAYQTTYPQPAAAQTTIAAQPTTQAKQTNSTTTYSGYDAALYSAATMYVAQQSGTAQQKAVGWQNYKKPGIGAKTARPKAPPKPQQLHYCDVCKISCAGPQTYREHLEGQKHKKREAATKMAASVAVTTQNRAGNSLRCQLCDVTCTGNDAYAAHIRGAKHQKVVLLHTKLGKPIPPQEPEVLGGAKKSVSSTPKINFVASGGLGVAAGNGDASKDEDDEIPEPDIQPVGQDYIEEIKSDDGKVISFNCKLCECRFNDPNAKEMHMKGRRHRLQYKKKVNPELVVDVKPSLRQRRIQEEKMRRAALREEFWARRHYPDVNESLYWEEQRRYEDEYMMGHGNMPFQRGRPFLPGGQAPPGVLTRRTESSDDKHVMARHAEIYPKEEELQAIQRIVSHTERALKAVSDQMGDGKNKAPDVKPDEKAEPQQKEDGRDNQLFSFQQGDQNRILKGVMRVGHLAKGLLLRGDTNVELVVLCADKPTLTLLKKVVEILPSALKQVAPESGYTVAINASEAGLIIAGDSLTVLVQFTSPIIREQPEAASGGFDRDVLSRGKCLQALAALRHTKWFQARALGLHSCVIIIRILRDLCQRVPTWSPLSPWAMELLAEKVISSVPGQAQLSPGDALRRVMEAVASGLLLPGGPGLADPCEKDNPDASGALNAQQREDLTCSAQYALRLIAYRQIYKVLGMDPLPTPQKSFRRVGITRKRRLSGSGQDGSESDSGKMVKTQI